MVISTPFTYCYSNHISDASSNHYNKLKCYFCFPFSLNFAGPDNNFKASLSNCKYGLKSSNPFPFLGSPPCCSSCYLAHQQSAIANLIKFAILSPAASNINNKNKIASLCEIISLFK